jgi:hypothetical protein
MTMPPLWKIARELKRPFQQLKLMPSRISTLLFGRHYFDMFLAPKTRCRSGKIAAGPRVAVYLIFPQQGLLQSHLEALSYLTAKGYAPIVVSNIPLSDADASQLAELSWLIVERPNFGYDFGGYRDGILQALDRLETIQRLVLLNDSAWFPLPGAADWLERAEQLQLDFVGAASNYGHPRVDVKDFKSIRWSYSPKHRSFHYCSFALMFSQALLSDPKFRNFWKRFPLTNNKKVTVRRGEIGLSQWVMSQGFSHGSTLELDQLHSELAQLSDAELKQEAEDTIILERPSLLALKQDLLAGNASPEDLRAFILTAVSAQGVSYALPGYVYRHKGFAFLKKSPCWLDEQASDITLAFAQNLPGEIGTAIATEAADVRLAKAPRFGPVKPRTSRDSAS